MIAPTTTALSFWQFNPTTPGRCIEYLLARVWVMDIGEKSLHWNTYAAYSQEQLRHEIESQWQSWKHDSAGITYAPWVWALKLYLWHYPLDVDTIVPLRHDMGPFWLMHVRHTDDDWDWFFSVQDTMPLHEKTILLGKLPYHRIGHDMALRLPPVLDGYTAASRRALDLKPVPEDCGSLVLLNQYADALLDPGSHFYPRWRAFLICMANFLGNAKSSKKKVVSPEVRSLFTQACKTLRLAPTALWQGFDPAWVAFAKPRQCTTLLAWDRCVVEFSRPVSWRQQLHAASRIKA